MRLIIIVALLTIFCISDESFGIDNASRKKYPFQLLTNDYGILNQDDLAGYVWNMNPTPFSETMTGLKYWQCFSTATASFSYKKEGYDDEDKVDLYNFIVSVKTDKNYIHRYERARLIPKDFCEEIEAEWKKLISNQPYICLGGSFIEHTEEKINETEKAQVFTWNFDKIKTKSGCDSYFTLHGHSFCGMTYKEYQDIENS